MSSLKAVEKEMKKEHKMTAKELDHAHKQLEAAIKDEQKALKVRASLARSSINTACLRLSSAAILLLARKGADHGLDLLAKSLSG